MTGCRAEAGTSGKPDATIAYGTDPLQHVDLWRPAGKGPFPVVLMIHGGCWRTGVATAEIMDPAARDLRDRGVAVWNVEYRGVDRPGGGYPGTFLDVAAAADLLQQTGGLHGLKTDKIVAIGHSAGGHLALWLAARPHIPSSSRLHATGPLLVAGAVSLGGLPDLQAASVPPASAACGGETVARLVDASHRSDPFADTSPARLPQPAIPILLVTGAMDGVAPPALAEAYAVRAGTATSRHLVVAGEDHMDEIAPTSGSWAAARDFAIGTMRAH
jgi:acetyl esterase/lipase